ncbi:hypothetical protein GCM10022233_87620 [Streptomyces shaanxiensis]|uniref:Uncharacterized protein n=1 Tax=Streptomyces shaanxiensis TaxID=653357 RepID=A0ABP7WK81_9ACTN
MFHPSSSPVVDGVLRLLLRAEVRLATSSAVRDEKAGALVAAVGDDRGSAAGPVDAGLRQRPAVVAAAGQRDAEIVAATGQLPDATAIDCVM